MRFTSQFLTMAAMLTVTAAFAAVAPGPWSDAAALETQSVPIVSERTEVTLVSFDGATIPITVYRPVSPTPATPEDPVPVLLHSHGWAGARTNSNGAFSKYIAAGFGVVSIDMRGHGASDCAEKCVARVHNVDFEIKDVSVVIDHVASLPWVQLDAPGDPVLGALGGSYGGGYQMLTAVFDARLDAMAPEITWNSLPQSLAPNGAIRSDWVHLLYWGAQATGTHLHANIHAGYLDAMATNEFPDGSGPSGVDIVSWFEASSPAAYPDGIAIQTLLIQGMPDTLFNLNEAVGNFVQIEDQAPVWLFAHRTGHILNTANTLPGPGQVPIGIQPPGEGSPCGDVTDLIVAFYVDVLKGGGAFTQAPIELAFDDGSCREFASWPPAPLTEVEVPTPVAVPSGPIGPRVLVPLWSGGATLAGISEVSSVPLGLDDATLYFSLVAVGPKGARVLDAQVTPFRFDGTFVGPEPTTAFLELGGVASVVAPSETLFLEVATWSEQFATNADRVPEGAALLDLKVGLPMLCPECD